MVRIGSRAPLGAERDARAVVMRIHVRACFTGDLEPAVGDGDGRDDHDVAFGLDDARKWRPRQRIHVASETQAQVAAMDLRCEVLVARAGIGAQRL